MNWSFELNLTIFLIISFLSHYISVKTRGKFSLQLVFGIIFMFLFGFNLLPTDFIQQTGLLDIGRIAYNVLIIHAGTMFSLKELRANRKAVFISLSGFLLSAAALIFGLSPVIGRETALIAAPSVTGGGATCAIASVSVLKSFPQISFFPWLLFMLQCLFGLPIFALLLKKEKNARPRAGAETKGKPPFPIKNDSFTSFKNTAFYLAFLMLLSLLNRYLFNLYLADTGLSLNLTALLIGILIGETGLIDRAPLMKADCFGLLMLGLMALMANSLASVPAGIILKMLPSAFICFIVSSLILLTAGGLLSKPLGFSRQRAMIIAVSSLVPVPVNVMMIRGILGNEDLLISETKTGSLYIVNIFSVLLISITVSLI